MNVCYDDDRIYYIVFEGESMDANMITIPYSVYHLIIVWRTPPTPRGRTNLTKRSVRHGLVFGRPWKLCVLVFAIVLFFGEWTLEINKQNTRGCNISYKLCSSIPRLACAYVRIITFIRFA